MPNTPETTAVLEDHDFEFNAPVNEPKPRPTNTNALTTTARPKMVGGLPPSMGTRSHRSHGRGGEGGSRTQSRTKKLAELRVVVSVLAILLVFSGMAAVYYWSKFDSVNSEVLSLTADLSHAQKELDKDRELLRQQDSQISAMVSQRIPGLSEIIFDKLFNLNDKYVHRLTFSHSGVGAEKVIEFHLVMENKTRELVLPNVRILLLDHVGLQVGMVKVSKEQATNAPVVAELTEDETRTYSGIVPVEPGAEPKYFLVQVK